MNARKFLVLLIGVLVLGQLGSAQTVTSAQVQARAALAEQTGKAVPLVQKAAAGTYRPHIWVAGRLRTGQQLTNSKPTALPSFCNVVNSKGGFNFCPNAMRATYQVDSIVAANGGAGMTIGIVDAFHYANAKADLDYFNSVMGLDPLDCQNGHGCFTNVDQNGGQNFCGPNANWELETMLDIEWAHAMAPKANIVLVEGCDNNFDNLDAAVQTAVKLADVISNSYGTTDFIGETAYDWAYYNAKPILFSSGDWATPTSYPCSSPYVTCVGGTRVMPDPVTFARVSETGWSYSGGGCSFEEPAQNYQLNNGVTVCGAFRATPDIAADADPDTGAIVYDSGNGGWYRVGGTSLSSPLMAGIFADLNTARTTVIPVFLRKPKLQGATGTQPLNNSLYLKYAGHNTGNPYVFYYYDVVIGNNGLQAGPGYDMVTGLGVLNAPHAGPPWNLP